MSPATSSCLLTSPYYSPLVSFTLPTGHIATAAKVIYSQLDMICSDNRTEIRSEHNSA